MVLVAKVLTVFYHNFKNFDFSLFNYFKYGRLDFIADFFKKYSLNYSCLSFCADYFTIHLVFLPLTIDCCIILIFLIDKAIFFTIFILTVFEFTVIKLLNLIYTSIIVPTLTIEIVSILRNRLVEALIIPIFKFCPVDHTIFPYNFLNSIVLSIMIFALFNFIIKSRDANTLSEALSIHVSSVVITYL